MFDLEILEDWRVWKCESVGVCEQFEIVDSHGNVKS